jgi:hypothetical protein
VSRELRSATLVRVSARSWMLAAGAAILVGAVVWLTMYGSLRATPERAAGDLTQVWRAARTLRFTDESPYTVQERARVHYPYAERFAYPLTAVVPWLPAATWSPAAVAATMSAFGAALFLLASARRPPLVWGLATWSMNRALALGNWSPLLTAAAVLPPAQLLLACKPNLALALFAAFPSRWAVAGGAFLSAVSFALIPDWPLQWMAAVRAMPSYYVAPVTLWHAGGPLLLLALLRWRSPEGRLLAVLACVPQHLVFYDQLPLFLVARTHREGAALAICSWLAAIAGAELTQPDDPMQRGNRIPILLLMYLPALIIVLRHPRPVLPGQSPATG